MPKPVELYNGPSFMSKLFDNGFIGSYKNGNYIVTWTPSGMTKRACKVGIDSLIADFPDSIDLKISNKCSWGCPFCHESSVPDGKVFDFDRTIQVLSQLPKVPIEIAIGGGNILETPVETQKLINWLINEGYQTRITLNYKDAIRRNMSDDVKKIIESVGGVGVSVSSLPVFNKDDYDIDMSNAIRTTIFGDMFSERSVSVNHPVIHIIAGIFPPSQLNDLFDYSNIPILVLGYKQWGRAKNTDLPEGIKEFEQQIKQQIYKMRTKDYAGFYGRKTLGFDNLALEQLDIKSALTDKEWDRFYLGEEGHHSMYIDAVEGTFARTSRSSERVSWNDVGLLEYFKSLR